MRIASSKSRLGLFGSDRGQIHEGNPTYFQWPFEPWCRFDLGVPDKIIDLKMSGVQVTDHRSQDEWCTGYNL